VVDHVLCNLNAGLLPLPLCSQSEVERVMRLVGTAEPKP
jgi:hypothetical protein